MIWRSSSAPELATILAVVLLRLPITTSLAPSHRAYGHLLSGLPNRFADSLIRDLNLLPGILETGVEETKDDLLTPRLVERKLNLEILGDSGAAVSLEQLGHHAGYYRIDNSHAARLFYFFFESRSDASDPVVIWLTGGPGCSSEMALFYENGPFKISDNFSLVWNDYGWDKVSNIIFVDQPTGTGFSYSTDLRDLRYNEKGVSDDLYDFLQAFFKEHPGLLEHEFYITGESYAGHYIPAFAERVHRGNKEKQGLHINLKGFAIGNGLTDPKFQYGAYADYAYDMGLIGKYAQKIISKYCPVCELAIELCGSSGIISCAAAYILCNSIFTSILLLAGNVNYYDVRKVCEGNLCYDFSNMETFLNRVDVKEALGVGIDRRFISCNTLVYEAMITDWMRNLEVGIPALVDDGIKTLIYAGEYDLICNWLGNYRWVNSMEWSGHQAFVEAPLHPFIVGGKEAGLLKNYGPLTFLKVHDAGHMVPMDQPKAALEMLERWTKGNLEDTKDLQGTGRAAAFADM